MMENDYNLCETRHYMVVLKYKMKDLRRLSKELSQYEKYIKSGDDMYLQRAREKADELNIVALTIYRVLARIEVSKEDP